MAEEAPAASARPRFGRTARIVAPVAAAALIGGAVFALDHSSSSNASAGVAPAAFVGQAAYGGRGGPLAGEQYVQGTVTAKTGSTVTVKSSSGTATYTVNATAEIVRNGQAATLAEVQVGAPGLVHVYPSSGQMLVERLFAGPSASDDGPGGYGPPRSDDSGPTT